VVKAILAESRAIALTNRGELKHADNWSYNKDFQVAYTGAELKSLGMDFDQVLRSFEGALYEFLVEGDLIAGEGAHTYSEQQLKQFAETLKYGYDRGLDVLVSDNNAIESPDGMTQVVAKQSDTNDRWG
jgi:hypothetical protein